MMISRLITAVFPIVILATLVPSIICQAGCGLTKDELHNGALYIDNHPLQLGRGMTTVKEETTISYRCKMPDYEMYVDGKTSPHPRIPILVQHKVCKNGKMEGPDLECLPARCVCTDFSQPEKIQELKSEELEIGECYGLVESGDFIFLKCASGNDGVLVGQQGIECHAGEWQPFDATCNSKRDCEIPAIENAVFLLESRQVVAGRTLVHGDVAEVRCAEGYRPAHMGILKDEKLLMSCNDGHWSHNEVTCVLEEKPTTCKCDKLYAMSLLQRNVKPAPCVGVVNHGDRVDLECRFEGMVFKNEGFVACNLGTWIYPENPDVRCVRSSRPCKVPEVQNALYHIKSSQVFAGTTVGHGSEKEVTCAKGYTLAEVSLVDAKKLRVKCTDGRWNNADFSCIPAQCRCDNIVSESMHQRLLKAAQCNGTAQHDHKIEVNCRDNDLILKKDGFISCELGVWVNPLDEDVRCERKRQSCVVQDVASAVFNSPSGPASPGDSIENGEMIEMTCEPGFLPVHGATTEDKRLLITCDDGQWSRNDVFCIPAPCKCEYIFSTSMQRRYLKAGECNGEVDHGEKVKVECSRAVSVLKKEGFIECRFGEWSYPEDRDVRCNPVGRRSCVVPTIENAVFRVDSNRAFAGHRVSHEKVKEVTCKTGYSPALKNVILNEKLRISCNDGQWMHSDISCVPAQCDCEHIGSPDILQRYLKAGSCVGKINHGRTVDMECRDSNLIMVKNGIIKCEHGSWIYPTDKDVRCQPRTRSCVVPDVENGMFHARSSQVFVGDSVNHGETNEFSCKAGFSPAHRLLILDGTLSIRCEDGKWSRTEISCIPAKCDCENILSRWMARRYLKTGSQCNGFLNHGSRVELACSHPASVLKEEGSIACENGGWKYPESDDVRCVPKPCSIKPGQFPNADLFIKGNLLNVQKTVEIPHGTRMRFECESGDYEVYRDDVLFHQPGKQLIHPEIICLSGILIGRKTECRPARCDCSDLLRDVPERFLELDDCEDQIHHGESSQLECKEGYASSNAPFSAECTLGKWAISSQAKCEVKSPEKGRCSIFPDDFPNTNIFEDGNVIAVHKPIGVSHGSKLRVSCKSLQYELYVDDYPFGEEPGDELLSVEMVCLNGVLKGYNTECRPARCSCNKLEEQLVGSNLVLYDCPAIKNHEDSVRMECVDGYYSHRASVRAECNSGKWTVYPKVTCERHRLTTTKSPPLPTTTASSAECYSEENGVCFIETEDKCLFTQKSYVVGFYQNYKINEPEVSFSEGAKLVFRCEDITTFKFTGSNNRTCVNGKWTNDEPKCTKLHLRSRSTAPVITYKVRDGQSSVLNDGTLQITKGTSVILSCHWFEVFGDPAWYSDRPDTVVDPPEWNSYRDIYYLKVSLSQEKQTGRYTCKNPHGKTHTVVIKVKSSIEDPEKEIEIKPTDDRLPEIKPKDDRLPEIKPTDDLPPIIDVPVITRTMIRPTTVPTIDLPTIVKPTGVVNNACPFPELGGNVLRFYKGGIIEAFKKEFPIGDELVFRCREITNFNFSGSVRQTCTSNGWTGKSPKCTQLQPRHLHNAPIITYDVDDGDSYVSPDGTLLVSPGSSLTFHCQWFKTRGTPTWMAQNPHMVQNPPAWNRNGDSYNLELLSLEERHSGWYTCVNPYRKAHTIRIRVAENLEGLDDM